MKLDHFVINVDRKFQVDKNIIKNIKDSIPYEPKWGKGTKGFKVSNLWIGNEYLEMVHILKKWWRLGSGMDGKVQSGT